MSLEFEQQKKYDYRAVSNLMEAYAAVSCLYLLWFHDDDDDDDGEYDSWHILNYIVFLLCTQNSNLVLEADREARRRTDEATGEVETWDEGKLAGKKMGDRVARTRAPEIEERLKKSKEK